MKTPLGQLEPISLRKAWAHEASEFTPWLAQAFAGRVVGFERAGAGRHRAPRR